MDLTALRTAAQNLITAIDNANAGLSEATKGMLDAINTTRDEPAQNPQANPDGPVHAGIMLDLGNGVAIGIPFPHEHANAYAGQYIGLNDVDGTPLHVGDRVHVTGSSRYGEFEAVVVDSPDGGRVRLRGLTVALEPDYTSSTGRIRKVARSVAFGG